MALSTALYNLYFSIRSFHQTFYRHSDKFSNRIFMVTQLHSKLRERIRYPTFISIRTIKEMKKKK